ncbi:MAG: KilA-N domain-containing protein [Plesiomonas shigelloides]
MSKIVIAGNDIFIDNAGMYCLNHLHKAAMAQGKATEHHKPSNFTRNADVGAFISALELEAQICALKAVKGGRSGVWAVELVAMKYAGWIDPSYEVQVYKAMQALKHGDIKKAAEISGSRAAIKEASIVDEASFAEIVARSMNMSNSGKLGMFRSIEKKYGLTGLLPSYAVDAPSDVVAGSSRTTQSLTEMLKSSGAGISARVAYQALADAGIVERKDRPSKGGRKEFWCVTSRGLVYGKNITSPHNPRETQPHFFESRTGDLIQIIKDQLSF